MAFSLLRRSASRIFGNFEWILASNSLQSGEKNVYLCGCVPTVANNQSRNYVTRKYSEFIKPKTEKKYESDFSDSDVEIVKRAGESKFWRRKMRTFHGILDINNDGVISFDDFQLLADNFVNLGHMSEEKADEFRQIIRKIWEKQWGEIGPYNLVTVEQYLEDMLHVVNDKSRAKKVHSFLPYLFEALDKDKSGEISVLEYKLFFECLGLSDEDAVVTFRLLDKNADGKLTMKEFVHHGKEFFLSEDENKLSKYFWGPLVEK